MTAGWDWFSVALYCMMALIGVFCLKYGKNSKSEKQRLIYYGMWLISWSVFASFRAYGDHLGGTDTIKYVTFFEDINSSILAVYYLHYDVGYWALNQVVRLFSSDVRVYFLVYYSILVYSYITFIDNFIQKKTAYAPYFLIFFLYLRGFTSMRSNISVAFLLLALVALKKHKNFKAIIMTLISCLMHKATLLFAGVVPFYWLYRKRIINIKTGVFFAMIAGIIGSIARYYIGDIFDSSVDAYASYAMRSVGTSFFDGFWKIVFDQLVLLIMMIIINSEIISYIKTLDAENKRRLIMVRTFCMYDFIIIPITFTLSIWRGPEYLYLSRLIMWGAIFEFLATKYIMKKDRQVFKAILYVAFIAWFLFRLDATWEASSLLPYIFSTE